MSKAARYVAAVVATLLVGGASFCLIGCGEKAGSGEAVKTQDVREFAIEGMSCQGCVDTITEALSAIPGVASAKVSLSEKKAVVSADKAKVPTEKIVAAVEAAGYKARPLK